MAEEKIKIIMTVPNQKVVTVQHTICDKEHIYTQCNVKANKMALKELSPNAYKLYMYFDLNQHNYTFALSYKDVHEYTGMSDKTYQKSVNELIDKGYLVQSEIKNQYIFYDGKINGDYGKVEITQRESTNLPTNDKNEPCDKGRNYLDWKEETTGEILHNTTENIINNNNYAPDTSGADNNLIKEEYDSLFNNITEKQIKEVWSMFRSKYSYKDIKKVTGINNTQLKKLIDYGIKNEFRTPNDIQNENKMIEKAINKIVSDKDRNPEEYAALQDKIWSQKRDREDAKRKLEKLNKKELTIEEMCFGTHNDEYIDKIYGIKI